MMRVFKGVEEKSQRCLKGIFPEGAALCRSRVREGSVSFFFNGRKNPKIKYIGWIYQRVSENGAQKSRRDMLAGGGCLQIPVRDKSIDCIMIC